LLVPVAAQSKA